MGPGRPLPMALEMGHVESDFPYVQQGPPMLPVAVTGHAGSQRNSHDGGPHMGGMPQPQGPILVPGKALPTRCCARPFACGCWKAADGHLGETGRFEAVLERRVRLMGLIECMRGVKGAVWLRASCTATQMSVGMGC